MVRGIDSFRDWFRGYESSYVVIGGTACDLLLGEVGEEFRVTKDIDMVLIMEAFNVEIGSRIWEYVKEAGYDQRLKSSGAPEYYRFVKPKSSTYPAMIELFSRRIEGITLPRDATLTPLPIDDEISSLSAILLDEEYYHFLRAGATISGGISVLGVSYLIPFKAKAWLNLTERKAKGEQVQSRHIRKHKSDIIRLSALLSPEIKIELPANVTNDMAMFLSEVNDLKEFDRIITAYNL